MIIKAVFLFLAGIMVLAMFGKLKLSHFHPKKLLTKAHKSCPKCKAPIIGRGPCPCRSKT